MNQLIHFKNFVVFLIQSMFHFLILSFRSLLIFLTIKFLLQVLIHTPECIESFILLLKVFFEFLVSLLQLAYLIFHFIHPIILYPSLVSRLTELFLQLWKLLKHRIICPFDEHFSIFQHLFLFFLELFDLLFLRLIFSNLFVK